MMQVQFSGEKSRLKAFYTADNVAEILGVSKSKAYVLIRTLNKELANKIKSKTLNEYGIKIEDKVYLEQNDVLSIIEDLLVEIGNLEEKYEDLERDMQDNYKHIPIEEQI